jgi:holo-ACP synthase/triphosphoribosyl-dephospho-CoA synthase
VDLPAQELKQLAMDLEDTDPIGRLFDMDVLDTDGKKLSREELGKARRKCLLCDRDAAICARSRAHGLDALQDRTGFLLYLSARQWMTEFVAVKAFLALTQEVSATPKPGLVDRRNQGAHKDMGVMHFFASANALRPYFCRFAEAGFLTRDMAPEETFAKIRAIGLEAEQAMYKATHGVNTHKGAIFSIGLVCAAAGRLSPEDWQAEKLLGACAAMTKGLVANDFAGVTEQTAKTAGERIFAQYGISGVRGQAEAGFPAVLHTGLPVLEEGLAAGLSMERAGCAALLSMLTATADTNLLARSDRQTAQKVSREVALLLAKNRYPDGQVLSALDEAFVEKNLSPGGTADLLSAVYFLHFLTE